jgi:hypothetical protein
MGAMIHDFPEAPLRLSLCPATLIEECSSSISSVRVLAAGAGGAEGRAAGSPCRQSRGGGSRRQPPGRHAEAAAGTFNRYPLVPVSTSAAGESLVASIHTAARCCTPQGPRAGAVLSCASVGSRVSVRRPPHLGRVHMNDMIRANALRCVSKSAAGAPTLPEPGGGCCCWVQVQHSTQAVLQERLDSLEAQLAAAQDDQARATMAKQEAVARQVRHEAAAPEMCRVKRVAGQL